tara:strand:- start:512 stop:4432 length:3921 start_codon:yes stop_codon:yes gene_type:complete
MSTAVVSQDDASFDHTQLDSIDLGSRTWNIADNGGFTAVMKVKFEGDLADGNWQRLFEFGDFTGASTVYTFALQQHGVLNDITFFTKINVDGLGLQTCENNRYQYNSGSQYLTTTYGTWHTIVTRWRNSDKQLSMSVDGVTRINTCSTFDMPNYTPANNYIGGDRGSNTASHFNGQLAGLYAFDRYLDDTEVALVADNIKVPFDMSTAVVAQDDASFDRTQLSQIDLGPRTWNIASNGGLTIVTKLYPTSNWVEWEDIFRATRPRITGTAETWDVLLFIHTFRIFSNNWQMCSVSYPSLARNTWTTLIARYNKAENSMSVNIDPPSSDGTTFRTYDCDDNTAVFEVGSFTTTTTSIGGDGEDPTTDNFNGQIAGLYAFDRYLDDTEVALVAANIQVNTDESTTDGTDGLITNGFHEILPCNGTHNRQCSSCQICGIGFYEVGVCNATHDRVCAPCGDETYKDVSGSQACSSCFTCPAGQYQTQPCLPASDRQCTTCPDNTTSLAQSLNVSDCQCAPGYGLIDRTVVLTGDAVHGTDDVNMFYYSKNYPQWGATPMNSDADIPGFTVIIKAMFHAWGKESTPNKDEIFVMNTVTSQTNPPYCTLKYDDCTLLHLKIVEVDYNQKIKLELYVKTQNAVSSDLAKILGDCYMSSTSATKYQLNEWYDFVLRYKHDTKTLYLNQADETFLSASSTASTGNSMTCPITLPAQYDHTNVGGYYVQQSNWAGVGMGHYGQGPKNMSVAGAYVFNQWLNDDRVQTILDNILPYQTDSMVQAADSYCGACPPNFYKPDMANTACTACPACPVGTYIKEVCTSTTPTVCEACPTESFSDTINQASCQECTPCPTDQYETTACTASSNRQCTSCPPNATCPAFSNNVTACECKEGFHATDESDVASGRRLLGTSLKCTQCPPGRFKGVIGNHDCGECYCDVGKFATKLCQPSQNHECFGNCRSKCEDYQFQVDSCRTTSDLQCQNCSVCAPNQYMTQACTKHQDTQCANCTVCPANEYAQQACTAESNTVCQSCTTCLSNEYQVQACTATTDTRCLLCWSCSSDQYQQSPCTTTTNTICAACTTCGANQYASPVCSDNSNAVCNECASCDSGKFIKVACTTFTDTECEACLQCPPGEEPVPGTRCKGSANTVCRACEAGKYKEGYNNDPCTNCAAGYTSPSRSTTADACVINAAFETANSCEFFEGSCQCKAGYYGFIPYCRACAAGKFQMSLGFADCLNCPAGTYSTTEGATSDTVCQLCSSVANTASSSIGSGATSCACKRGYVWNTVSNACDACASGTFMSEEESECQVCKRWN